MKMNWLCCFVAILTTALEAAAAGGDLAPVVADGSFWKGDYREQAVFQGGRYNPVQSGELERIRWIAQGFSFSGVPLGELLVTSDANGEATRIVASVYNRGDDGRVDEAEFLERLRKAGNCIEKAMGVPGKNADRKTSPSSQTIEIGGRAWYGRHSAARLEWSVKPMGARVVPAAEWIRLELIPLKGGVSKPAFDTKLERNKVSPKTHVIENKNGGKEIQGIPMVDQGAKGYCAAASAARLLAYYGLEEIDQNQIAAWAGSDPELGTNPDRMMDGIARVLHDRYRLVARQIDPRLDVQKLFSLCNRYNQLAKREKRPEVLLVKSGVIDVGGIFRQFDRDLLVKVRCPTPNVKAMWIDKIKRSIDVGVPVLWSVYLGIVPEPEIPQVSGGHMRLIIGYEDNGNTILYSDSWGERHARKSMRTEDAIAITTGLRSIAPTLN